MGSYGDGVCGSCKQYNEHKNDKEVSYKDVKK